MEFVIQQYRLRATADGKIERYYDNKTIPPRWKPLKGYKSRGYMRIELYLTSGRRKVFVHRLVYYAYNQDWDIWDTGKNNVIDHKDRNRSNNKIENLQQVTNQQNHFNTGAKGYSFRETTGKYDARIVVDRKLIHLGGHDTPEEAHEAYLEAKKEHHRIP